MTRLNACVGAGRPAVADYPPGARFGPRTLHDFELVWLLSGSARWREHGAGGELTLAPGHMLLIPRGARDEFRWDPAVPTRHGYVHFTLHDPASGGSPPEANGWPRVRTAGPLAGLLDYLVWLGTEPSPDWHGRCEEAITLLVRIHTDGPLPDPRPVTVPPAVAAALAHVRRVWQRGARPLTLGELAAAASVSRSHLAREFMRAFGVGAVGGFELVRLSRAATLLSRSNLTVTEVATACGFPDPLHFSRRFRATYGRSPRAYRSIGGEPVDPAAAAGLRRLSRILDASAGTGVA
jgi:AraC family transcriptional regulator